MNRKRLAYLSLFLMFAGLFGGLWTATQQLAKLLNYSSVLGPPVAELAGVPLYWPWQWLLWAATYYEELPEPFTETSIYIGGGFALGVFAVAIVKQKLSPKDGSTAHGSSRWAHPHELEDLGLSQKPAESRGVVVGRHPGSDRLLTHGGKEHVFVFAPTRSGKGVGLVVPTLLTWRGSVFVLDIKGENWALTAGWRARFSHAVYFDPTNPRSAHFNPLLEVKKGKQEVRDVRNIVDILANPDGETKADFWNNSAKNFLEGAILHVLYAEPDKSLAGVLGFLRDPRWTHEQRLNRMLATPHLPTGPHPTVARAAKAMLNAPENTRGGILSTVESYLGLYSDPIIAEVTSGESDFRLRDLQFTKSPVSLYLVVPPSDLLRVRSLLRLMLVQLGGALTAELGSSDEKHPLLLLLDEFPTLGKLDWFESALAYIAGYDIKALLIAQDLNQIEKAYGQNNAILGNCHVRVAFAPNDERTARRISEMLGKATAVKTTKSLSGKRSPFGLDNMSKGEQEYARDLMTAGEILQLPPDKQILFVAGHPPILAEKVRYYEDAHFRSRCPGLKGASPKEWATQYAAPVLPRSGAYPDRPPAQPHPWHGIIEPIEVEDDEAIEANSVPDSYSDAPFNPQQPSAPAVETPAVVSPPTLSTPAEAAPEEPTDIAALSDESSLNAVDELPELVAKPEALERGAELHELDGVEAVYPVPNAAETKTENPDEPIEDEDEDDSSIDAWMDI